MCNFDSFDILAMIWLL